MKRATFATPQGTEAFSDEADLVASAYAQLGRTGLVVSRLGFGTYRVDDRAAEHEEALTSALLQGVNLIDTSSNYGDGHAERLVGKVVARLVDAGKLDRAGVVTVSKVGYAQGENLKLAKEREAAGNPFPGMVKVADELWHGFDPAWIEDQLGRSLERLGMDGLDVLLLHNPEYFLADAKRRGVPVEEARRGFDERLRAAFERLEVECDAGRIRWYGVSSNTFAAGADDAEGTCLTRMLAIAREVAAARGKRPDEHRFAVAELPLNLLEDGAARVRKDGPAGDRTVIEHARAEGVGVLANRPLNAFAKNRLVRLAEPPAVRGPKPYDEALEELRVLEAIFLEDFARRIQVEGPGPRPEALFRWAELLADAPAKVAGIEHWNALQAGQIGPQTNAALQALSQAFGQDPSFQAWARRYVDALGAFLGSATAAIVLGMRKQAEELRARIEPVTPPSWRAASLSRQAIAAVLACEGVTSALVGMRRRPYVEDALGAVALPPPSVGGPAVLAAARAR